MEFSFSSLTSGKPKMVSEFKYTVINDKLYRLDQDLLWFDGETLISIPSGFYWNGASVPYIFQWYEGIDDHLAASCVHDWLYNFHFCKAFDNKSQLWIYAKCTKTYADTQWWLILHNYYNVTLGKDFVLTSAVVLGGWIPWLFRTCNFKCVKCKTFKDKENQCPLYNNKITVSEDIVLTV